MKAYGAVLSFAALASAFVMPEEAVMREISIENNRGPCDKAKPFEVLRDEAQDAFSNVVEASHDAFDNVVHSFSESFESAAGRFDGLKDDIFGGGDHHPHQPPHKPHHPHDPHHDPHKPNLTVYELIKKSKYSTKFAELVDKFDDVVEALNSTKANVTVFVPTDKAFEKIPDHGHKPSKEILLKVLAYHIVRDIYPAGRVLGSHTIPTSLGGDGLSDEPHKTPQRLNVKLGWTGLFLDSYSRIVYPDIFGTNGVAHAIDHILIPPPDIPTIIKFSPTAFSTLELAILESGLFDDGPAPHLGSTLFAPPNFAWKKLGPRVNAFLFSKYGKKYLKAILEYHIVVNQTLYSDAYYGPKDDEESTNIPKGLYHVELPTLLEGKSLSVDIARYGRFIELKVNAFSRAVYQDGVAYDGVLHVINNVLLPPKKLDGEEVHYNGEEISVDDLKDRLAPFVDEDDFEEGLEL